MNEIDAAIERMLDFTARRQQALASNIANLDTPGYKAKDVAFQQELSSNMQLTATDPSHKKLYFPCSTPCRLTIA
jgi:flagellar basal-body rod protein FlgB